MSEDSLEDLFDEAGGESTDASRTAETEASADPGDTDDADAAQPTEQPAPSEARTSTEEPASDGVEDEGQSESIFDDDGSTSGPAGSPPLDIDEAAEPQSIPRTSRLTTGVDVLDAYLDGGVPPGRILSILAPPDTQGELLVKHLAATHDCLYLSTLRPKWEVEEEVADFVQRTAVDGGDVTDVRIEQLTPDGRLEDARQYIETMDMSGVIVIDSINEMEQAEPARYTRFIDDVKERIWETGSVAILYGIEDPNPSRGRTITLRRADLVWQLRRSVSAEAIDHQLVFSKFRSGRALAEPIDLELTDDILVDSIPGGSDVGSVLDGALDD